jgi:DNA-3-methyladenine glycosylase II
MIITEQFLSLQAAAAIWARLKNRLGDCTAEAVLACSHNELLALGLSRAKVKSFHAVASQNLVFQEFETLNEATVTQKLCALPGVGPWTADIFLLSVMGAADAWPVGDLALRVAVQDFLGLAQRPEIPEMTALAEDWRPYRAVAARLLWSHYRGLKGLQQA